LSRDYLQEDGVLDISPPSDPDVAVGSVEAVLYNYSILYQELEEMSMLD